MIRYKNEVTNILSNEYQREEEEKKSKERQILDERRKACETGLDVKYDRNVNNFKKKINNMSDKVDINAKNYINFCNQNKNNYEVKKELLQLNNFNNSIKSSYNQNDLLDYSKLNEQQYVKDNNENFNINNHIEKEVNNNIYSGNSQKESDINNVNQFNYIEQLDPLLNRNIEISDKNHYNNRISDKQSEGSKSSKSSVVENMQDGNQKNHSSNLANMGNNIMYGGNNTGFSMDKYRQNSPEYKKYYSYNPQKEYNLMDTKSDIRGNIISHLSHGNKILDEAQENSKKNYKAINKSILEFNQEQVAYKNLAKILENDIKKNINNERLLELQKLKLESQENQMLKIQNQQNYKNILDNQLYFGDSIKNTNDPLKFYVHPKNYYLGNTQLEVNPIVNPVNNYSFAKYYLNQNNLLSKSHK